jgi:hypothetical protein
MFKGIFKVFSGYVTKQMHLPTPYRQQIILMIKWQCLVLKAFAPPLFGRLFWAAN